MNTYVILKFDIEGYHFYPNAPEAVSFLRYNHRHLFRFEITMRVQDLNREFEIFIETQRIKDALHKRFGTPCDFENFSCEQIANWICLENTHVSSCAVLEDNMGGAIVYA